MKKPNVAIVLCFLMLGACMKPSTPEEKNKDITPENRLIIKDVKTLSYQNFGNVLGIGIVRSDGADAYLRITVSSGMIGSNGNIVRLRGDAKLTAEQGRDLLKAIKEGYENLNAWKQSDTEDSREITYRTGDVVFVMEKQGDTLPTIYAAIDKAGVILQPSDFKKIISDLSTAENQI